MHSTLSDDMITFQTILLGSKSPRRRELLSALGVKYNVVDISCDESYPPTLKAGDIPLFIAKEKANAYRQQLKKDELLITADTIVWLPDLNNDGGILLGKPKDEDDACRMLSLLSGRTHEVYTAVCLTTSDDQYLVCDRTEVSFRELSKKEIQWYVKNYRPLDKAGAYGVQEWIGLAACIGINGSYFNVMGLPVHRIAQFLM